MEMERIDLHIHSNKSDGKLSPKEIILEAAKNGVSTISITDHDTVDAYDRKLLDYASKHNVKIIPGIEISTKINKCGIHVLGYSIDYNNKETRKGKKC